LFEAPWAELERYRRYLAGKSELATHQVVKGSEFTHVMVVMDDEQSGGNQISYDKLFGATELESATGQLPGRQGNDHRPEPASVVRHL
jgi:DNA helicase-2/ATP-dependent DNA helicase PcrA